MEPARPDPAAIARTVAIALAVIALALLLVIIVLHTRTTLRWLAAAVFLALAIEPAVELLERPSIRGRHLPRPAAVAGAFVAALAVLALIVVQLVPPAVQEVEELGSELPHYVADAERDLEKWDQFRELNEKFDITGALSESAKNLPSHLGDAANGIEGVTVGLFDNLAAAIVILTMTFFMLLDGGNMFRRFSEWFGERGSGHVRSAGSGIRAAIRGYVTVNLLLALAAGVLTWIFLEIAGMPSAVPLAILVFFFDLVPLIGLTLGGVAVAIVLAFHDLTALIVWAILFLGYQQLQDRVVQPMLYGRAVQINPLGAIVALLVGAQLAGILGALLAIPTAAALVVVLREIAAWRREVRGDGEAAATTEPQGPADPAAGPNPAAQT